MFIEKITICNLFAYYGKQEIEFLKSNKKLYSINGKNSFGKTSFIRCAKLLFLGTGINENQANKTIPEVIQRFNGAVQNPTHLILGTKNWLGILNESAKREGAKEFYVHFKGQIKDKPFSIKRSWIGSTIRDIEEKLEFKINNKEFSNEDAQVEINNILDPRFVEFFFFDGEEMDNISNNLRSSLKEKILAILQITPLEIIIKQTSQLKGELLRKEIDNKDMRSELEVKKSEAENRQKEIDNAIDIIKKLEKQISEQEEQIKQKERKINQITADQSDYHKKLQSELDSLDEEFSKNKYNLPELIKNIVFLGNLELVEKLSIELDELSLKAQKSDIDVLKKMLPEIKHFLNQVLLKELKEKNSRQIIPNIVNSLEEFPNQLKTQFFSDCKIPVGLLFSLKESIARLGNIPLKNCLQSIQKAKKEIKDLQDEKNELNQDEASKIEQNKIQKDIDDLENLKRNLKNDLEERKTTKIIKLQEKEELDKEISRIEENINTERIDSELQILECLKTSIQEYKDKLIDLLRHSLHDKILKNYKNLLSDDNVNHLEINESFEIKLKNNRNEDIFIANQSSGQRQLLAISIIWALSELSKSKVPLIIDTPLGRIDQDIRLNIIKQYYCQNSRQVIILPHKGEMGHIEYQYAKDYLAELYEISNLDDRQHASIKVSRIEDYIP